MTANLMQIYVKNTRNFIKNFTKIFLAQSYNEEISEEYINTYIDARIYNFGDETQKFFYKKIYSSIINKKEELKNTIKDIDEKLLEDNLNVYQFILYLDGVRPFADLKEFVKTICESRKSKFELCSVSNLENRIYKETKRYLDEKEALMTVNDTKDFSLDIEKCILIDNTYNVNINYNFKFPYIYSNKVIQEVYNDGVINEDKLLIEYMLLSEVCVKDINKCNFATKYLVDFASSLYEKTKKLKQITNVLNDAAIQDKVYLKIKYNDFEEYKELIYSLMKDGFKFAMIIDETFNPSQITYKKISIFEYLIVPEQVKCYSKIKDDENKIKNIIIYE